MVHKTILPYVAVLVAWFLLVKVDGLGDLPSRARIISQLVGFTLPMASILAMTFCLHTGHAPD